MKLSWTTAKPRPQVYKGLLVCRSIENPPIKKETRVSVPYSKKGIKVHLLRLTHKWHCWKHLSFLDKTLQELYKNPSSNRQMPAGSGSEILSPAKA